MNLRAGMMVMLMTRKVLMMPVRMRWITRIKAIAPFLV